MRNAEKRSFKCVNTYPTTVSKGTKSCIVLLIIAVVQYIVGVNFTLTNYRSLGFL